MVSVHNNEKVTKALASVIILKYVPGKGSTGVVGEQERIISKYGCD